MAFSGLHVLCALAGQDGDYSNTRQPLLVSPQWSQTMAAAGTTTNAAASAGSIFRVRVSAPTYIATGSAPDASQTTGSTTSSARELILPDDGPVDRYVAVGDKLAWVLA
ncbi:hypothetical protein BJF92_12270 [Rhizobium rhizosphaerae]|uniref:Uncharacterized protein n=2 Tax=Xaviernesmea rhizosphaerae TaxID=1672749 RepID=A0A1Q9AN66_9HYPH|nr:hypothetical protein BJF92_12270 [Xaviernesmea rhizosphaerae]